jgi:peptidoglycan/LPS O-acetylase OafA/YrhL
MTGVGRHSRDHALDALRGLAALSILALHALGVPGGTITGTAAGFYNVLLEGGLAVFFVLSGYLISGPFVRALLDGTPMPTLRGYSLRRVTRIVPAYWLAFFVTAQVIATTRPGLPVSLGWGDGRLQAGDWLAAAFFVQNALPSAAATGVLLVMWTLCVEILFYATVPLLAVLAARRMRRATPMRLGVAVVALWAVCVLMEVLLPTFEGWQLGGNVGTWVWVQFMYLSVFCPGVLLAIARTDTARQRWRVALAWLGSRQVRDFGPLLVLAAALCAYLVRRGGLTDLGLAQVAEWRRQPAAIAAAVVVAMALTARGRSWALFARVVAPLGTISYGIYLYHWVVLRVLVDRHVYPLDVPGWAGLPAKVGLAIALTLPLAALSYWVVERPAMRWAAGGSIRRAPARRAA